MVREGEKKAHSSLVLLSGAYEEVLASDFLTITIKSFQRIPYTQSALLSMGKV
jgi:hypothetical protein